MSSILVYTISISQLMLETRVQDETIQQAHLLRENTDLVGVEDNEGAFLIQTEMNGPGVRVLADTSNFPEGVGHRMIYSKSLPPDASLLMLPSNFVMSHDRISVAEAVRQVDCIYLLGGEDPGPVYTNDQELAQSAAEYGGINEYRDLTTNLMILEALRQGKDIAADCAGFERLAAFFGMILKEVDESHRVLHRPDGPDSTKKPPVHHDVDLVRDEDKSIPELDEVTDFNTHHHLGAVLVTAEEEPDDEKRAILEKKRQAELFEKFGIVLYHASYIGKNKRSYESFYGKTATGSRIFAVQGHPERDDTEQGEKLRVFMQNFINGSIELPI